MAYDVLRKVIDEHWGKGKPLTKELLDAYRSVLEPQGTTVIASSRGPWCRQAGLSPVEALRLSWREFVSKPGQKREASCPRYAY